jgi:hypothetical protein
MGIFQGDVIIKAMVDLSMDEMRKNVWLLDHCFESLKAIPYISDKYGQNNIDAAKEWFLNNKIDVYLRPRNDKDQMPCITIFPGSSNEKEEMKTEADASTETITLMPSQIGKPIPYVVKPFVPTGYDADTGEISLDPTTVGFDVVTKGMVLVNIANGTGYVIQDVTEGAFVIAPDQNIDATEFAVIPQFPYYQARIEHTFCQENYTVGCYVHGDPQNVIWLWSIVLYAIYRYRETLLEGNGFAQSVISSGELLEDPNYEGPGGEQAFVRFINITGQIENSWIKAPKRYIESIVLKNRDQNGVTGGIKILSNLDAPPTIDPADETWYTVADDEENT